MNSVRCAARRLANGRSPGCLIVALVGVCVLGHDRTSAQNQDDPFALEIERVRFLLNEKGDFQQAQARARALYDKIQHEPDVPPARHASAIDVLVESLLGEGSEASRGTAAGRAPETLALARRAVDITRNAFGAEDSRAAYSHANLGLVHAARLEFAAATTTLREALQTQEQTLGAEHPSTARTALALGGVLRATGDLKTSRVQIERALLVYEKTLDADDPRIALALISLSATLDRLGDWQAAAAHDARAADIVRTRWGPNHPLLAQIVGNMAWAMDQAGQFEKSAELHREAIALYERSVGPEHVSLAWALNNYGLLHWRTGDYEGGRPLLERALAIWTKAESPDASRALNNLAVTFRRMGDRAAARRYYDRSLALKEKTYGPNHPEVALVVFNTANLMNEMGDFADARRLYERALRIREEKLGATHTLTAYAANGLGVALLRMGQPAAARPHFERAAAIWERLKVPDVAIALASLGELSLDRGHLDAALSYYDRAQAIYVKAFGPEYADVAILHHDAATVLTRQGKYAAARDRYRQALAALEKQFGPDYPGLADVTAGLGAVEWHLGRTAEAGELALRSERIGREHFRLTSRTLSEREAINFSATRAPALDLLLTIAVDDPSSSAPARRVADAVIRSRALVLDEVGRRNRFRATGTSEAAAHADRLAQARNRLANLIVRGPGDNPAAHAAALTAARLDRDAAERQLAAVAVEFRDHAALDRAGLEEVLGSLPADTAIVSFVKYRHLRRSRTAPPLGSAGTAAGESRYAALILRAGPTQVTVVPLGAAATVDNLVTQWRQDMNRVARLGTGSEAVYRRTAMALARAVWVPLTATIGGAAQVFLVPDGSLNLVSFAALPDGQNGYLVETGPLVHYLSTERDLLVPSAPASARGLLALGNPSYNTTRHAAASAVMSANAVARGGAADCAEFQRVRFGPLASTAGEIDDIAALWTASGADISKLTGAEATEAAFKKVAPRSRVIHLATHGFFLGSCGASGSHLRGVGGVYSPTTQSKTENPLALSGLAMAGANQRKTAPPDEDDGILTAEEVASLDLNGVEWAVLSACDTGLGEVRAGEGVFGLRRAFAAAGVRTTIMSLWSVGDRSTREWMKALYDARLTRNRSTAQALQDASLSILRHRRAQKLDTHPYFWAAFVAAGDWR